MHPSIMRIRAVYAIARRNSEYAAVSDEIRRLCSGDGEMTTDQAARFIDLQNRERELEADAANELDATMRLTCPECGEEAQVRPPKTWPPALGRTPPWSHLDGEPLCPVIGPDGYTPAIPSYTPKSRE